MDIRNRRALKDAARERLAAASYNPRTLALLHIAISAGAALLITVIDYYLSHQIADTGGLSGIGVRSVLGTVQTTLQYAQMLVLPFWEIGFIYTVLRIYRGEQVRPMSLLEGFRRFGPVLRLRILQSVMYVGAAIGCAYLSSFLFAMTPLSQPVMELLEPMLSMNVTVEQMEELMMQIPLEELIQAMMPFFVIFGVVYLAVCLLLMYRFRVADFLVMDKPRTGALMALALSTRMTRKKRWQLAKLDLSFWWFYGLQGLVLIVSYLDLILPALGIALPVSADLAWFVFYILGLLAQILLFWYSHSYVQMTRAAAYEVLCQQMEEENPIPQQPPKKLPWDDYETQ